jgi:hypothetical protein
MRNECEPMLNHDELAEQIGHMEPLAVGGNASNFGVGTKSST